MQNPGHYFWRSLGLCAAVICLGLSGCADKRGGPIAYDVATFGVPDAPTISPLEQGYRIASLDTVAVKVFKKPEIRWAPTFPW